MPRQSRPQPAVFQVGKYYKWVGPTEAPFYFNDQMRFVYTQPGPFKCVNCGTDRNTNAAAFAYQGYRGAVGCWSWDRNHWKEVGMEILPTAKTAAIPNLFRDEVPNDLKVGVEIELVITKEYMYDTIASGLRRVGFRIDDDGSIRYRSNEASMEIKTSVINLGSVEDQVKLTKALLTLDKYAKDGDIRVNKSCGLHIHASPVSGTFSSHDRQFVVNNVKNMVVNRKKCQVAKNMMAGVAKHRFTGHYSSLKENNASHFSMFSVSNHYPTVEARAFQASTDANQIAGWIKGYARAFNLAKKESPCVARMWNGGCSKCEHRCR